MTQPSSAGPGARPVDSDLDHQIAQLRRRREEVDRELDEHRRSLAATLDALRTVRGRGSAEDEAVVVEVDAQNRLLDLQLDPRALRLGSIAQLRTAILVAARAASEDAAAQLAEAGARESARADPVAALLERMPEVSELVGPDLLRTPEPSPGPDPEPAEPPRPDNPFE
ncbi:hypothetical protein GC722_02270 [Auraticoccus sp. F435]|uniref:YbaB/EbfC family DNA-binding protein n=1 Tax=Auraticoccus cholistanensis TaxID=2656650 RepID=A0A6A9UT59_9ACTN|nr:YbaB/EbfC family nucleoid-associated protein [Auraticoccus cholistanensis]MVA74862.1 hypothetical protein [Auraticoccus cholistanensis]